MTKEGRIALGGRDILLYHSTTHPTTAWNSHVVCLITVRRLFTFAQITFIWTSEKQFNKHRFCYQIRVSAPPRPAPFINGPHGERATVQSPPRINSIWIRYYLIIGRPRGGGFMIDPRTILNLLMVNILCPFVQHEFHNEMPILVAKVGRQFHIRI